MMLLQPPVLFLVFIRPQLTARVFARIREAWPTKLFVVANNPWPDRVGEAEKCTQVLALIKQGIDRLCEFVRNYSAVVLRNLDCCPHLIVEVMQIREVYVRTGKRE